MISEEKMIHIVHVVLDGLEKQGVVTFPDKTAAMREAKRVALAYQGQMEACAEAAAQRIRSQRNAPMENSRQWDTLYQKYYEEEVRKMGG